MDKYERRRIRLKRILEEECDGKVASLARRLGKADNYVHRMLYEPDRANRKRIGEDSVEAVKREFGVDLDEQSTLSALVAKSPSVLDRRLQWIDLQEAELLSFFRATDDQGRETMLETGREVPKVLFDELASHKPKHGAL